MMTTFNSLPIHFTRNSRYEARIISPHNIRITDLKREKGFRIQIPESQDEIQNISLLPSSCLALTAQGKIYTYRLTDFTSHDMTLIDYKTPIISACVGINHLIHLLLTEDREALILENISLKPLPSITESISSIHYNNGLPLLITISGNVYTFLKVSTDQYIESCHFSSNISIPIIQTTFSGVVYSLTCQWGIFYGFGIAPRFLKKPNDAVITSMVAIKRDITQFHDEEEDEEERELINVLYVLTSDGEVYVAIPGHNKQTCRWKPVYHNGEYLTSITDLILVGDQVMAYDSNYKMQCIERTLSRDEY